MGEGVNRTWGLGISRIIIDSKININTKIILKILVLLNCVEYFFSEFTEIKITSFKLDDIFDFAEFFNEILNYCVHLLK